MLAQHKLGAALVRQCCIEGIQPNLSPDTYAPLDVNDAVSVAIPSNASDASVPASSNDLPSALGDVRHQSVPSSNPAVNVSEADVSMSEDSGGGCSMSEDSDGLLLPLKMGLQVSCSFVHKISFLSIKLNECFFICHCFSHQLLVYPKKLELNAITRRC